MNKSVQKRSGNEAYFECYIYSGMTLIKGSVPNDDIVKTITDFLIENNTNFSKTFDMVLDDLHKIIQEKHKDEFWGVIDNLRNIFEYFQVISRSFDTILRSNKKDCYRYWARTKNSCEICLKYHDKLMQIKDVSKFIDNYLAAAKSKNVDKINKYSTFLKDNKKQSVIPPLHIGCRCSILMIVDLSEYKK